MKKRVLGLFMAFAMICTGLVGCGSGGEDTIKIGVAGPFTGDYSVYGDYIKRGVEMAVERINAEGGVQGKQIEVVYGDDKGSSTDAVSVAQKFATDDSIVGIVGHFFSGCTLAAGQIYQQNGIPTVAMASTNPEVADIGDCVYRVNVGDNYQGGELAKILTEEGYTRAVVLFENTDYGMGVSDAFAKGFEELGGTISLSESYNSGSDDFSLMLTNVKQTEAEVIVLAGYDADAAKISMQSQNLAIDLPVYASDGVYTENFINLANGTAEGTRVVCYFHPDNPDPSVQAFIKEFKEKYDAEVDSWSVYCYDAMMLMADAIARADSVDRESIRSALAATTDFVGVTGPVSFESSREPAGKEVVIVEVKGDEYVVVE